MNKPRFIVLAGVILAAAASRMIPHPPNFTPVAALALFGGASFASKRAALLVPLAAMFLSDLVLGFYSITPAVYVSFALVVGLGLWLRRRKSFSHVAFAVIASALLFFVLTNFGVWALAGWYSKTWTGLGDCCVAAIPFFRNTLASSLLYSALLFGGLALAEKHFASLCEPSVSAA
jgi:predicted small integral membrane protein